MKINIFLTFAIIVFIFISSNIVSQEQFPNMYVTPGNGLNMRSEPSTQARIIRALPFLTEVVVLDKSENFIMIDNIYAQWYRIQVGNDIGWVFSGYLSQNINLPKIDEREFIAVYRFISANVTENSYGYNDIMARIRRSYLLVYEPYGRSRYIYDNEGLIDYTPRFGDGVGRSEYAITGILSAYDYSIDVEENQELHDQILITLYRSNQEENHHFEIRIIYEKVVF